MSQAKITTYFINRKRRAPDDIANSKSKIRHIDNSSDSEITSHQNTFIKKNNDVLITDIQETTSLSRKIKDEEPKRNDTVTVQCSPTKQQSSGKQKNVTGFAKKINAINVAKSNESYKSESLNTARKELSLGDIKKRLAGSSKLAEIKASAERISKGIQQLKETTSKRNLKEFKSIDVELPSSPSKRGTIQNELLSPRKNVFPVTEQQRPLISPRKVVISPIKSPNKVPAYIKHASLATSSTSLPLPHHYKFLAELFRSMETVVSLLYNRNEKITFNKLKPSVQEMLKRNFTEKHLAQIKHLVPDFYNFEMQKIKNFSTSNQKESFELIISPYLPNNIKGMNPSILLERRRYFYDVLLQLVKKHHAKYLQTVDPPMVIPDDKLTRWHPEFELEKVPDVECAKLPTISNEEKFSTAQDVLTKARELFCNTKMERALQKLAQAKERGLNEEERAVTGSIEDKPKNEVNNASTQLNQPSTSGINILNPALRNLPTALLEKVKAKQAAKALEAMTRSSKQEEKYLIYSRLPDLARTLRNIFVTERKNVLPLSVILSKLDSSFKSSVTTVDLHKDIKVLSEEVPEWIKLHDIRNTTYVKMDRNADQKKITYKLESLVEKYKD